MTSLDQSRTAKEATAVTAALNAAVRGELPFDDQEDFEEVRRGLILEAPGTPIDGPAGRPIWHLATYDFESVADSPPTVNPSLWRQSQLNRVAGLFQVTDRIFQLRGLDISNMSIIEGDTGLIVIDPLLSVECVKIGMDLYRQHRGDRPVVAVIYTHSHGDHYGGVRGVVSDDDVAAGRVKIYAPEGFLYHAISENVFAGNAMSRRAHYQYGVFLPHDERGQVDLGLGKAISAGGTVTLLEPTHLITEDVTRTIDGVEIEFQLTPGTEAPAEMNFYFPAMRALCGAENACHTMHNLLTLRGAQVRDPRIWAHYLDATIAAFGDRTDVLFTSHHWPRWGTERIVEFLADQRDMYQFLHDQTLRLANHGLTPLEIAQTLTKLAPALEKRWYLRGYYGSISHNVRAVYQRYLGYYDGNPAHLNPHPPVEAARRYVAAMGGPAKVLQIGRAAFDSGDYRWTAELVNHLVFAEPDNADARALQADALEQLGYQCENGTWRSLYLMGAHELRNGVFQGGEGATAASPDTIRAMSPDLFFDYLGIRLNGDKAAHVPETRFTWVFTDIDQVYALTLRNAALTHRAGVAHEDPHVTVTLTKKALDEITLGRRTFDAAIASGDVTVVGDRNRLAQLLTMLDDFELMFDIVTP